MNPLFYVSALLTAYKLNASRPSHRNSSLSNLPKEQSSLPTLAIYSQDQIILSPTPVKPGLSVLDATINLLKSNRIPYEISTDDDKLYLVSIANINQSYNAPQNTWNAWLYVVNSSIPDKLAGDYIIKKNDTIEWIYSTNYITRDLFGKNNIGRLSQY